MVRSILACFDLSEELFFPPVKKYDLKNINKSIVLSLKMFVVNVLRHVKYYMNNILFSYILSRELDSGHVFM
jgi:hypothetical protein